MNMLLSYLTICLILTFSINILGADAWRCDYKYSKQAKGYYKLHNVPATWQDARLRCQLEGAALASPYPEEVHEIMKNLVVKNRNTSSTIFTGIHATLSSGVYHTINGTPLGEISMSLQKTTPPWAIYDKNFTEDCTVMKSDGTLAAAACDERHPYICYKEKTDDDIVITACGTSDRAYEYSEVTHSCYKYHVVPRTWERAHMACIAEGGHLAIINSNEEANFIKTIYNKNPDIKVIGKFRKDIAWLGFRVWNDEGDYRTIYDESLIEAGYQTFASGEPNYPDSNHQFCGCSFRNALLCDYLCKEPIPFICEKKPNSLVCEAEDCTATALGNTLQ